jgi:hypothetical protein
MNNTENLYNRIIGTPTLEGIDRVIEITDFETLEFLFSMLSDGDGDEHHLDIIENQMIEIATNESLNESKFTKNENVVLEETHKTFLTNEEHTKEMCSVCLSNFNTNENLIQLDCKHFSHTECLNEWVKYKTECPVCRSNIKTTEINSCHF